MLARFLYDADGRVRVRHMIAVVATCICLALFGTFFLVLTPALADHEGIQTAWVLFSVFMLKFPLVSLLWWFIARNKEWPTKAPKWSEDETKEILDYLVAEANRCRDLPDAPARLAYLRGEAWNVADRVSGDVKVDAVNVALHIDEMTRPRARRSSGG